MQKFAVKKINGSMRLDKYLRSRFPNWGRKAVGRLIARGDVLVNGRLVHLNSWQVKNGDQIQLKQIPEAKPEPVQQFDPAWIVAETAGLLAVDKPAGMLSQPTRWKKGSSLHELVEAHFGKRTLFHRLDRDTSGLVLFSRNAEMNRYLDGLFQARLAEKSYLAVVALPNQLLARGDIRVRLAPDPQRRDKMTAVLRGGKSAFTRYEVVGEENGRQLVRLWPVTGRTHQLRVHLAHLNAPILGDRLYGRVETAPRLMLHAHQIRLPNEDTTTRFFFKTAVPTAFHQFPSVASV